MIVNCKYYFSYLWCTQMHPEWQGCPLCHVCQFIHVFTVILLENYLKMEQLLLKLWQSNTKNHLIELTLQLTVAWFYSGLWVWRWQNLYQFSTYFDFFLDRGVIANNLEAEINYRLPNSTSFCNNDMFCAYNTAVLDYMGLIGKKQTLQKKNIRL